MAFVRKDSRVIRGDKSLSNISLGSDVIVSLVLPLKTYEFNRLHKINLLEVYEKLMPLV